MKRQRDPSRRRSISLRKDHNAAGRFLTLGLAAQVCRRDDVVYQGHADLGLRLGRARISTYVSYTSRQSEFFADFGIDGLQAGARVEYSPQQR